jgi:hypothetical protein
MKGPNEIGRDQEDFYVIFWAEIQIFQIVSVNEASKSDEELCATVLKMCAIILYYHIE